MRKILRLPLATPKIRAGVSVGLTVTVLTLIAWRSDTAALGSTLTAIKPTLLLLVLGALTTGALLAAARLKLVASDFGYDLGWREAIAAMRSEEHTSELQSLMRISYAVVCLKKNTKT